MDKKQMLQTSNKKEMFFRCALLSLVMTTIVMFAATTGMMPVLASGAALDGVMDIVIGVISDAAFYIGVIIVLWGAFQIVLAFRREDSEGISKQITTVVVGGVLVGFGALAEELYAALR